MNPREQIIEAMSNRGCDVKSTDGDYSVTFIGCGNKKEFTIDIAEDADVDETVRAISSGMNGRNQ